MSTSSRGGGVGPIYASVQQRHSRRPPPPSLVDRESASSRLSEFSVGSLNSSAASSVAATDNAPELEMDLYDYNLVRIMKLRVPPSFCFKMSFFPGQRCCRSARVCVRGSPPFMGPGPPPSLPWGEGRLRRRGRGGRGHAGGRAGHAHRGGGTAGGGNIGK